MHHSRFHYIFVALVAALLTACGGGGGGFAIDANPLVITSNSIDPTLVSGDVIDWEIPLNGGCSQSGPFVVEVIAGQLPDGVGVDFENGRHHLTGVILEDGNFNFTVKVTDSSCTPFATTTLDFAWSVAQGPVRIVGCNPPLVPNADFDDPLKYPDADALETVVYSSFVNYDLIVAGGQGPYTCSLVDDPTDPDDGNLPVGLSFAVNSCSMVGRPIEVGPGGRPFRYTIRVTDSVGNSSEVKLQHKIDTPPIIFATSTLTDGKAGRTYFEPIAAIDGVPPLSFELIDNAPNDDGDTDTTDNQNDNIDYVPGFTPTIVDFVNPALPFQLGPTGGVIDNAKLRPVGGRIGYPSPTEVGPNYAAIPMPPEGIYLTDTGAGSARFDGIPRRRGDFRIIVHAFSSLVPNERGQHAFKELSLHIDPSEPPLAGDPAFDLNATWTMQPSGWLGSPEVNDLPPFEVGKSYNPDGDALPGLQLSALGGVASDGVSDGPHASDLVPTPTEPAGTYKWAANWAGTGATPPSGIAFSASGLLEVTDGNLLEKIGRDFVDLTAIDHQLPSGFGGVENETTRTLAYSIGPDSVIVTLSSDSMTITTNPWTSSSRFEPNDSTMKIKRVDAFSDGPSDFQDLVESDLTHPIPAASGLTGTDAAAKLLSGATGGDTAGVDFLIGIINPSGWWHDMHGMNPIGGRHGARGDPNPDGLNQGKWLTYYYYGSMSYGDYYIGNWQPNVTAVELPDAEGVPAGLTQADGVYADGGRMYPFESSNRFGLMVVRENGKVYVPFAYQKSGTTYTGFGDGTVTGYSTSATDAYMRTVQMTISPNGRIGALKLKKSNTNLYEQASDSAILLVSLTGEKVFGESSPGANDGTTYKIMGSGSSSTGSSTPWGSSNRIMYGQSMALTNTHLYFLIGCRSGYNSYADYWQQFSGHWIMRADVFNGSSATLLPSAAGDSQWTQSANLPMQTTFHFHGPAQYLGTYGNSFLQTRYRGSSSYLMGNYELFAQSGANFHEHTLAPTPFRVSRNGEAVAFRAGPEPTTYQADSSYFSVGSEFYRNYGWVDYAGGGARRITNTIRRTTRGSTSGYTVFYGPDDQRNWGRYNGPTPGLEISDDGQRVASVHNESNTNLYAVYGDWQRYGRENIVLSSNTGTNWSSFSESNITATSHGGSHYWRFGALMFTADNDGLVYWAGGGMYNSASSSYSYGYYSYGSFYIHDATDSSTYHMLGTSTGGPSSVSTAGTQITSAFNPTTSGSSSSNYARLGAIQPRGGFISRNRQFMYVVSFGALNSSAQTGLELVALNIAGVPGSGTVNGHSNGLGFRLTNWPSRRGFMYSNTYSSYWRPQYSTGYNSSYNAAPFGHQGQGRQIMAKDTGWVFWGTRYSYYSMYRSASSAPIPYVTYGTYGYYTNGHGVHIYGFNADMGGAVSNLSTVNNTTNLQYLGSGFQGETFVWMDAPRDGSKLAVVTSGNTATYNYYYYYAGRRSWNKENIIEVSNIDFDTTNGAMHAGFSASANSSRLEPGYGRAGEAMAFVKDDLYYSFKASASNDTALHLTKATYDGDAEAWSKEALTGPTGSGLTGRIHVLGGGR